MSVQELARRGRGSSAGFAGAIYSLGGGFGRGAEPPSEWEGVGNDLVFRDRTAAPTLLIGHMVVAGA